MLSHFSLYTFGLFQPVLDLSSGDKQGLADPSRRRIAYIPPDLFPESPDSGYPGPTHRMFVQVCDLMILNLLNAFFQHF